MQPVGRETKPMNSKAFFIMKTKLHRKSVSKRAIQVVDLFSGCGGMSIGFMRARTRNLAYRLVGAADIDPHANATYERMIGLPPAQIDVRKLAERGSPEKVKQELGIEAGQPFLMIGCAPCQGFSSHRKRYPGVDQRNSLIRTFAQLVAQLRP